MSVNSRKALSCVGRDADANGGSLSKRAFAKLIEFKFPVLSIHVRMNGPHKFVFAKSRIPE